MKIVNIIVLLLSVCSNFCAWGQQKNVNQLSREEEKDGFQLLFDGQSLNNWINNAKKNIFVEDGCIVKKSSGSGNLYSKEEFGNFYFTF
ncbi:MAG: family 16 glycoside hydrolase [Parabacteroides merdae]